MPWGEKSPNRRLWEDFSEQLGYNLHREGWTAQLNEMVIHFRQGVQLERNHQYQRVQGGHAQGEHAVCPMGGNTRCTLLWCACVLKGG